MYPYEEKKLINLADLPEGFKHIFAELEAFLFLFLFWYSWFIPLKTQMVEGGEARKWRRSDSRNLEKQNAF